MPTPAPKNRRPAAPAGPGWVYIFTNPSMPGLAKVGFTTRNTGLRAAELAAPSGVPTPFVVAWKRAVSNCAAVEAVAHRMLADHRVTPGREFFACDVALARQVIEAAAGALLRPWWVSVWRSPFLPAPRARRAAPRRRSAGYSTGEMVIFGGLILAVLAIGTLKPAIPSWLPSGVARPILAVEHLGRGF